MKKDNLDVDILAVLVEEVFEKVRDGLVCDVTADDDVSKIERKVVLLRSPRLILVIRIGASCVLGP